jgi:hypothetical protein
MNELKQLLDAITNHLNAGDTLRQALNAIKPIYNKANPEVQVQYQMEVAKLIGAKYKVKPIITNQGTAGFDRKTKAGNAARSMYVYYFPLVTKKKNGRTSTKQVSKQVDPITRKSKAIKAWGMTKAQVLKAVEIAFAK